MSPANAFRYIERHLRTVWALIAILCTPTPAGVLANAATPCDPLLTGTPTFFATTLQLSGGARTTADIAIPAHSHVLLIAAENGLDITLEAVSAGHVIGRTASPVYRTGAARLTLRTKTDMKASLVVTVRGDPAVHGQVAIRAFLVNDDAQNDKCLRAQALLAAGDSHYAQAQAVTIDKSDDSKTNAPGEYKDAADQYLAAAKQASVSTLQAYAQLASASVLLDRVQDWKAAYSAAQTAQTAYEREGDLYGAARARAVEAEASMEIALTFRSRATDPEGTQRSATELQHARQELLKLAKFHASRGELYDQAQVLIDIGLTYDYQGLYVDAIRADRDALSIFERLGEERWKTISRQNIALVDTEFGRVYDAVKEYAQLLQGLPANADPIVLAAILNNSALANRLAGHMDIALRHYADALQLEQQLQNVREQARSLLGIGSVYETLGDSDRALDFYRRAESLHSAELDARGTASSLRSTANALRARGQVREALKKHEEALSLASNAQRAPIQIQRARDLEALGQNDSALQQLESVIQRNPGRNVVQAEALLERAKIRSAIGEFTDAEADLRSAIETFATEESPVDAFSAWVALAQVQHKRGSTQRALDSLAHALKLAEEVRLQSASPELRASLLQPLRPAFDLKIELLTERYFALGHMNTATAREQTALDALSTAEQARARAFADFERLDIAGSAAQTHLLEQRSAIYRELAARHSQLESMRDRITNDNDEGLRSIRSDIAALRVQLDETDAQINASAAAAGTKAGSKSWMLDRRSIPTDTAIVEYWLGAGNAVAWVATHDRLTMVDLGASAKIMEAARTFHDSLRAFGADPPAKRLEDSAQLYASIIQPLERYIAPYRTLIFAPDGALHYIPFAALRASNHDRGAFLVENHDVAVTPSVTTLLRRPDKAPGSAPRADRMLLVDDPVYNTGDSRLRSSAGSRAAAANTAANNTAIQSAVFRGAYGTSLPRLLFTGNEANAITSLFPGHVDRLEGFAATKEHFLAKPLDRYRVIHVASHATTDAQIPGLSALAFSALDPGGKSIDNLVFAADFLTLRLNADLVVLSACDTALGKSVAGEGLMGLRYIALARGAGSVVASLWEVPDEATAKLMTGLYRSFLGEHRSVPAALSEAMRTMLGGSNPDPSEWGSFTAAISALGGPR